MILKLCVIFISNNTTCKHHVIVDNEITFTGVDDSRTKNRVGTDQYAKKYWLS
jgi:hypothetical protein